MGNQILKVFEGKRQKPAFSTTMIGGWILPSWFIKQSDLLNLGYVFGKYQFANICFRNWTAFCNDKGQPVLLVDKEGTISFPKIGVSIEIWVYDGKKFITPGRFNQTKQTAKPEFFCVETKSSFKNGVFQSRLFPIVGLTHTWTRLELNLYAKGESVFNDYLVCLVVRPFDHNGLTAISQLEYKNKRIKVNYIELLQLETEPKIVFCTHAGLGDVTDFLKYEGNKLEVTSMDGSCTGILGYSIRPADQTGIKIILKPDCLKFHPHQVREFSPCFWESEQIWKNRYSLPYHMLTTNSQIDQIYRINLNYLVMFNGQTSDWVEIYNILVLNRFAFYLQSRSCLLKVLKKVRWDGSLSTSRLPPEKLIYAIYDYYQFSSDINFVKENWQTLKRMGYWLIQNQSLLRGNTYRESIENSGWICASLKVLSKLGEVNNDLESHQFFHQQYQGLWSRILELFSRRVKEYNIKGNWKKRPVKETVGGLAISYPLCLYQKDERFIREWLDQTLEESTYKGGMISPMEFQGVDLELTARLGAVLLREKREYEGIFKFLIETISSTGNWPDRIHPVFSGGIGVTGHSPEVGCQFLLMLRNIMAMEEEEDLYLLPGIINSKLWTELNIELNNFPTTFGNISLKCKNIGKIVQIDFKAFFRKKPRRIRLILNQRDRLVYSDAVVAREGEYADLDPNFKIVRFSRGQ